MKHINIRTAMSFVIDHDMNLNRAMFNYHCDEDTFKMAFKKEDGLTLDVSMPFDMFVTVPRETLYFNNIEIVNENQKGIIASPGSLGIFSMEDSHIFIDFNNMTAVVYHSSRTTKLNFERSVIMSKFIKGVYGRLWRVD